MKNFSFSYPKLFFSFVFAVLFVPNVAFCSMQMGTIVCGITTKGENIQCDTNVNKCIKCANHSTSRAFRWLHDKVKYEYRCVNKDFELSRYCEVTLSGGGEGDYYEKTLFWKHNEEEGTNCIVSNFSEKYSYCYGCEVVETMSEAFVFAAGKAYNISKKASNAVLIVLTLIWLVLFALKNVSSFASIEPMKMLQELMVQLFKVILAFVIINAGIETILHYSLVPLMNAGTDLADAILLTAPSVADIQGVTP